MVYMGLLGLWVVILASPKSAPGPSQELIFQEKQIRRDHAAAKVALASARTKEAKLEAQKDFDRLERQLHEVTQKLQEADADLQAYPVPEYLQEARAASKVMVAVTGGSGVGKSSWINVVRRVGPKDAIAAATGVTETTPEPHMYPFRGPGSQGNLFRKVFRGAAKGWQSTKALASRVFKGKAPEAAAPPAVCVGDQVLLHGLAETLEDAMGEVTADLGRDKWEVRLEDGSTLQARREQMAGILPECVLWDLPGVGTPNFPKETYLKDMGVRHFDMVVLMTAERFTEAELDLLKELKRWRVPYFLVRNKTDMDVENEIEKEEDSSSDGTLSEERRREVEAKTIKQIKDFFKEEIKLDRVYCISARRRLVDQFDFRQLEQDMEVAVREQRFRFVQGEEAEALGVAEALREEPKAAEEALASTDEQGIAREEALASTDEQATARAEAAEEALASTDEQATEEAAEEALASTDEQATAREEAETPLQQSKGSGSSSSSRSVEVGSSVAANDDSSVLAAQAASEMKQRFLEDMKRAAEPGR